MTDTDIFRSERPTVEPDDLPTHWVEDETSNLAGQTFVHEHSGADATIYNDHGWTVTMNVSNGTGLDFETRHTYFHEAEETLLNAISLYNILTL